MRLVAEEMDCLELFIRDVVQAERLVPAVGEDIERDLSADGEGKAVVRKLLPQHLDERGADTMLLYARSVRAAIRTEGALHLTWSYARKSRRS